MNPVKIVSLNKFVGVFEAKFSKIKYNFGRVISSPWLIGDLEGEKSDFFVNCFFEMVLTLRIYCLNVLNWAQRHYEL